MDFVHDQLATGRKNRVLTVVDTFSRFSPVVDPRFSYRGEDVVVALEGACRKVGYPGAIRVDKGSEFISRDLDLCPTRKVLNWTSPDRESQRTMPLSNRSMESAAECLNAALVPEP
ncbi:MAG: transposase family protein [Mesorhizobium sp.]|nr:MAG: transposase family protein [Mesorhizobium sp.]